MDDEPFEFSSQKAGRFHNGGICDVPPQGFIVELSSGRFNTAWQVGYDGWLELEPCQEVILKDL